MTPRTIDRTPFLALALAAVTALASGTSSHAQCVRYEDEKILASDAGGVDYFGGSAASWNDQLIIGAPTKDLWLGGVYVFAQTPTGWTETAVLEASDRTRYDLFGTSVDLEGDVIVVGATQSSGTAVETGKVYVFEQGVEAQILQPSSGVDYDQFGNAVALSDSLLAVGAAGDDTGDTGAGAVYIFEHDGSSWVEVQKLVSPNPSPNAQFGRTIALEGDTLLVGSPGDGSAAAGAGAVYVYTATGSTFARVQDLFGAELNDHLGERVAMSDDLALAMKWEDEVIAFERTSGSWLQTQTLAPSDGLVGDFGDSLAIDGELAVIGAPQQDHDGAVNVGAAYAFRHDGNQWLEVTKLRAASVPAVTYVGSAVAIIDDVAVVGAERDSEVDIDAGSAFSFTIPALAFDLEPNVVNLADPVTLLSCGGSPGAPLITFVTAVGGVPVSRRLFSGRFNAAGAWSLSFNVPSDARFSGLDITMTNFTLMANGTIASSNDDTLSIQ